MKLWFKNKHGAIWEIVDPNVIADLKRSGDYEEVEPEEVQEPEGLKEPEGLEEPEEPKADVVDLESMTKAQLTEFAKEQGIDIKAKDTVEIIIAKIEGAGE